MFRRALLRGIYKLLIAAALIGGSGLAAPTAAQVSDQPPAVSASTMTPGRTAASMAGVEIGRAHV